MVSLLYAHIMRNNVPQLSSFHRAMRLLEHVIDDDGASNVSGIARQMDVPVATAHRQIATLVSGGWLRPCGAGRHIAGPRLLGLAQRLDEKQTIATIAAPILDTLAQHVRSIVQLATYENEMVTYRIKTGRGAKGLFTKVGMQLEAYCSGVGKVLLAHLPENERAAYLATGPFPALTEHTITDATQLDATLQDVAAQGFALDDQEVTLGLRCMAVPVRSRSGTVVAAISVSQSLSSNWLVADDELLQLLTKAAAEIEQNAFSFS